MPQDENFDYKNIDMTGYDEEQGVTTARENLSLSSEELKAKFMKSPIAFMTFAGVNPEEELSKDVQDAVAGINAGVRPIVSGDAIGRLDSISAPKAKELFKSLASSQFGVDNIEKLSMDQVNQLMQNDQLKAMNEQKIGEDATYLHDVTKAFSERDNLQKYDAARENNLNRMWAEVEPLTIAKAQALVQRDSTEKSKQTPQTQSQYTAPNIMQPTGINASVTNTGDSAFTYDENAPAATSNFSVDTPAPEAGLNANVQGEVDQTPTMTVQGAMENPNFTYDELKGATTDPITVNGNLPKDPTISVTGEQPTTPEAAAAAEQQAIKTAQNPTDVDFTAGFKMKDETRKGVAAKNKNASFWGEGGILEQFASSKSPEDAFQGLFVNMLLYLPALGIKGMEMKEAELKERNNYAKEKRAAFEEEITKMKGMGATDTEKFLHQDFIKTGGDMAALAAQIRQQNPKAMEQLGIKFDENGVAQDVTPKQKEALAKAVLTSRYAELYNGVLPSKDNMKKMWENHKWLAKSGQYKQGAQATAQEEPVPAEEVATPAPEAPKPEETKPVEAPKPEAEKPAEEKPVEAPKPEAEKPVETPKAEETQKAEEVKAPVTVENLSVNPATLGVNSLEAAKDKMISIDSKPLTARTPTDLKKAHELSVAVTKPTALAAELNNYSVTVGGLMNQARAIENDRSALTSARTPRTNEAQQNMNIRMGAERT